METWSAEDGTRSCAGSLRRSSEMGQPVTYRKYICDHLVRVPWCEGRCARIEAAWMPKPELPEGETTQMQRRFSVPSDRSDIFS